MRPAFCAALLAAAAACSNAPRVEPSPTAIAPTAAEPPAPASRDSSDALQTLAGRLRDEAEHRPGAGPRAEDVFAALSRGGIAIGSPRQYLGMTVKARYCAGGATADGLAVAVCEYASADDAASGKRFVEERYAGITDRAIHLRGATTLTLTGEPGDARRAAAIFESL